MSFNPSLCLLFPQFFFLIGIVTQSRHQVSRSSCWRALICKNTAFSRNNPTQLFSFSPPTTSISMILTSTSSFPSFFHHHRDCCGGVFKQSVVIVTSLIARRMLQLRERKFIALKNSLSYFDRCASMYKNDVAECTSVLQSSLVDLIVSLTL